MTIYVVGELNVDIIMTGADVIPAFNREKLLDTFDTVLGSSSAITACALAGLGCDVRFVSVVGDDEYGAFCIERLREKGVNTDHVKRDAALKTGVTLSFSTSTDRALMTYMGAIPCLTPDDLPESMLREAKHIHFGSYYLQDAMRDHWAELFHKARERGIGTSFDTGWDLHGAWHRDKITALLPYADLFMPSEEELMHIFGTDSLDEALERLPAERGLVAVKRGASGAMAVETDGSIVRTNAYDIVPVDTTGAGDSFNAGFIYGRLIGLPREEQLRFASACGALATQRIGGASEVPTLDDIERFMRTRTLKP